MRDNKNLQIHNLLRRIFPELFNNQNAYDVIRDDDFVIDWSDWDIQASSCASLDVSCLFSLDVRVLPEAETKNGQSYVAEVFL